MPFVDKLFPDVIQKKIVSELRRKRQRSMQLATHAYLKKTWLNFFKYTLDT